MSMWLNKPDSSSLIHRARSKFCANAIPSHGVNLFWKKETKDTHFRIESIKNGRGLVFGIIEVFNHNKHRKNK